MICFKRKGFLVEEMYYLLGLEGKPFNILGTSLWCARIGDGMLTGILGKDGTAGDPGDAL